MTDFKFDLQEKSISKIFDFLDESKKILILSTRPKTYQDKLKNKISSLEIPEIKFNDINSIQEYLSNKNNLDIITKKQNYDVIILDQILDFFYDPQIFLKIISDSLLDNGMIVGCVYNYSNIINRIMFLDGKIPENEFNKKYFLSLEDLLFSLSHSNLKITKLDRVEFEVTLSNQKELKNFILPIKLINSINNDPESQSFFYIFSAIQNFNLNPNIRKSIFNFSKNLVTEKLNDILNSSDLKNEKEIQYLKQTNREQYQKIKFNKIKKKSFNSNDEKEEKSLNDTNDYQNHLGKEKNSHINDTIQDKDQYIADIIQDKDAYLEEMKSVVQDKDDYIAEVIQDKDDYIAEMKSVVQDKDDYIAEVIQDKDDYIAEVIQDKDSHISQIIQDKDAHINNIKNSLPFKMCKILDKLTGKTRK